MKLIEKNTARFIYQNLLKGRVHHCVSVHQHLNLSSACNVRWRKLAWPFKGFRVRLYISIMQVAVTVVMYNVIWISMGYDLLWTL